MAVQLFNKGRGPLTLDLPSLGLQPQVVRLTVRDKATGKVGPSEVTRHLPASVTIPARSWSESLPDSVAQDVAGRTDITIKPVKE